MDGGDKITINAQTTRSFRRGFSTKSSENVNGHNAKEFLIIFSAFQ